MRTRLSYVVRTLPISYKTEDAVTHSGTAHTIVLSLKYVIGTLMFHIVVTVVIKTTSKIYFPPEFRICNIHLLHQRQ